MATARKLQKCSLEHSEVIQLKHSSKTKSCYEEDRLNRFSCSQAHQNSAHLLLPLTHLAKPQMIFLSNDSKHDCSVRTPYHMVLLQRCFFFVCFLCSFFYTTCYVQLIFSKMVITISINLYGFPETCLLPSKAGVHYIPFPLSIFTETYDCIN